MPKPSGFAEMTTAEYHAAEDAAMSEEDLLREVIGMAHAYGWLVAHFRAAKTEKGWRTPVQADGRGFFDLVLMRDRVLFVELKSTRGGSDDDQKEWMQTALRAGAECYLWRPSDLRNGTIREALR